LLRVLLLRLARLTGLARFTRLAGFALIAGLAPALKAASTDPSRALRYDG